LLLYLSNILHAYVENKFTPPLDVGSRKREKKHWAFYEDDPEQSFDDFLEWCVDYVGTREESAKGHFRHAGVNIVEM
jgi:hypothetical protein